MVTGQVAVSVVIPARNEARDLGRCLDHVLDQTLASDAYEVIVVDGASSDATRSVAEARLAASDVRGVVLRNDTATTPSNLNAGLGIASGRVLCRVDARSFIPKDYLERCLELLDRRPDLAVVGGSQVATDFEGSSSGRGIARALNNRFAMGGARYRSGSASGPDETVYLGAFRRAELVRAGGWDTDLPTNQDFDLNRRMSRFGTVWFEAGLPVGYRPRGSHLALLRQYHRFGMAKVNYWRHTDDPPLRRQLVLIAAPALGSILALASIGTARSRVTRTAQIAAGGLGLLFVTDHVGAPAPDRPGDRVHGVIALGCVGLGWSTGIWRQLVRAS